MFGAFIAHRVRVAWSHLARGDYTYALDQLARDFTPSSPATTRSAASGTAGEARRACSSGCSACSPAPSCPSTTQRVAFDGPERPSP
jgi:hypothetical protein